jgi:hypothetical protein
VPVTRLEEVVNCLFKRFNVPLDVMSSYTSVVTFIPIYKLDPTAAILIE